MINLILFALFILLLIAAVAACIYFLFDTWKARITCVFLSFGVTTFIAILTEYFIMHIIFAE